MLFWLQIAAALPIGALVLTLLIGRIVWSQEIAESCDEIDDCCA